MKRKVLTIGLLLVALMVPLAGPAAAQPTVEQVKDAIAKGVAWLAAQQDPDGFWGDWERCAVTALAAKKLEHHAVDPKWGLGLPSPFDDAYPYREHVEKGLAWLFDNCADDPQSIWDQLAGDPDSDGDGLGVRFGWGTYTTGIALMAICEAVDLDRVVESGPLANWTYKQVAQDTMDWLAFGQNEASPAGYWMEARGGWGYVENDGQPDWPWSDQSNSGYAVLGLQYAEAAPPEGCGFTIPQFVKDELNVWIGNIQNAADGGSAYTPGGGSNILGTGNLLKELAFVGATETDDRVKRALGYLHDTWDEPNQDPGWRGDLGFDDDGDGFLDEDPINGWDDDGDTLVDEDPGIPGSYQATYTTMKGLTSLGIHEFCDPPIDWQTDFETVLLQQQNPDGSWPFTIWDWAGDRPILSTIWALLTLQKVAPPPPVMGRMTGGGSVFGSRVTHGFELHCDASEVPNNLQVNWDKGNKFHLESLDSARCSDDPKIDEAPPVAGFDTYKGKGTGRYNGVSGATIEFTFTDAGEPGKNDFAQITITDASGVVLTVSGNLKNGNHQAHPEK